MKFRLLIMLFFSAKFTYAQEVSATIDTSNYYDYAAGAENINWLRTSDAVPILIDELKKAGYSYAFIGVGKLIKINDSTRLVVDVHYDREIKFGFVYEGMHSVPLNRKERAFLSSGKPQSYSQSETDLEGETSFMRVPQLPANVFLLRQTCYWYEYGASPGKITVTKSIAAQILRQDIRRYLEQLKNKK